MPGHPQDIEWAWSQGRLYILQSRPITSFPGPSEKDGPSHLWDNSNIQESYCGVTTPLTFSFAARAYHVVYEQTARLVGVSEKELHRYQEVFANLLGLYQGRVYYNLNNWYRKLLLIPSFDRHKEDLEAMLGVEEPVDFVVDQELSFFQKLRRLPTIGRTLVRAGWLLLHLRSLIQEFEDRFEAIEEEVDRASFITACFSELMERYQLLNRELLGRWQVEILNIGWVMRMSGSLRRLLEHAWPVSPVASTMTC